VTVGLIAAYAVARRSSDEAARINVLTDGQHGLLMLDLAVVPPAPSVAAKRASRVKAERLVARELPRA
jgi:hypothetical protein